MISQKESYTDFIESEYRCRTSLHEFAKQVWPLMEGVLFIDNWHVGAICEHLEAVKRREIRKIIFNLAPRTTKSSLIMTIFQTWDWIDDPWHQFLMVSKGDGLAKKAALDSLNILQSDFYRKRWGKSFKLSNKQTEKRFFINSKHGYRISTTPKSRVMGRGGHYIMFDDANSPYESETETKGVIEFWDGTLFNRANDPQKACWIILQQRTGKKDLTAHILEKDNEKEWVHFFAPMEFNKAGQCKTIILPSTAPRIWEDPRTEEGELLWPERFDSKAVRVIKATVGSYIYAGQYQQSPRDEEGGLVLRNWWKVWKEKYRPKINYIIQSWDTALTDSEIADFSACTTWGVFEQNKIPNMILLSAWKGRVRGPDLLKRAIRLKNNYLDTGSEPKESNNKYSPDIVIVEEKGSGYGLVNDLIERGIPAHGFNPGRNNKVARVNRASPYIECGFVWVAGLPPHYNSLRPEAEMVVEECALFPNGENDDVVDTVSQAILYLKEKGILRHIEEIMYLKDEIEDVNLPGHRKPNEREFQLLAEKQRITEEEGKLINKDPFDYIMRRKDEVIDKTKNYRVIGR